MLFFKLFFILSLMLPSFLYANTKLVVIVSKNSTISEISKREISRIFLAKTKKLPNGKKAITIEPKDKKYQNIFYKSISSKSSRQLKKYWAKVIFTGKGQPPKKMDSIEKIVAFVKDNLNAIAYIPNENFLSNDVKVVKEF